MENNTVIFTTAEIDYDYPYVRVLETDAGIASNGKTIRKVCIPDSRVDYQTSRYGSGMHMVVDEVEFDKLVHYKLVKVTERASVEEFLSRGETD